MRRKISRLPKPFFLKKKFWNRIIRKMSYVCPTKVYSSKHFFLIFLIFLFSSLPCHPQHPFRPRPGILGGKRQQRPLPRQQRHLHVRRQPRRLQQRHIPGLQQLCRGGERQLQRRRQRSRGGGERTAGAATSGKINNTLYAHACIYR